MRLYKHQMECMFQNLTANIAKFYAAQTADSTPYMMIYASGVETGSETKVSAYDSNGL